MYFSFKTDDSVIVSRDDGIRRSILLYISYELNHIWRTIWTNWKVPFAKSQKSTNRRDSTETSFSFDARLSWLVLNSIIHRRLKYFDWIFFRYYASGTFQKYSASTYQISKQHCGLIIQQVPEAIIKELSKGVMNITTQNWIKVGNEFNCQWQLPNC